MKRTVHMLILTGLILFPSLTGFSKIAKGNLPYRAAQGDSPSLLDNILEAHGGKAIISTISGYSVEMMKLIYISPTEFFERKVLMRTRGEKFERQTIHPDGRRSRREFFDEEGNFREETVAQEQAGTVSRHLVETSSDRLNAVRFSVETSSLIPFLIKLSSHVKEVRYLERTPQMLDKLKVTTDLVDLIVFADPSRLIRRIEIRGVVFQFADYRLAGGLMLPHLQRVSIGSRLVQEFILSRIEINPPVDIETFAHKN